MTIIARYISKNVSVEILDVFDSPEGKLASVRALDGKPFVGGDKWRVATCFATVPAADLSPETQPEQPAKVGCTAKPEANLLTLALAAARSQWPNSETVWLVGGPRKGAYLVNVGGWVNLYVVGFGKPLPIFCLDPAAGEWKESRQLRKNYPVWAAEAQQALEPWRRTCPVCRGKGKIFTMIGKGIGRNGQYKKWHIEKCPKCEGAGRIEGEKAEETR